MIIPPNVFGRYDEKEKEVLVDNIEKFIIILKEYYYNSISTSDVIKNLEDEKNPTSRALSMLVKIYSSASKVNSENYITELPKLRNIKLNPESGNLDGFIDEDISGRTILLKPNMVSIKEYPETSSFDTMHEIINFLLSRKANIIIGDGPSIFFDSTKAIDRLRVEFSGYAIVDLNDTQYSKICDKSWSALPPVEIASIIYDVDYLLNLSNFKEHNAFSYSGARKNMMGLISPASRLLMHRLPYDKRETAIIELSQVFTPQIGVMDARKLMIYAQQTAYGGKAIEGPGMFFFSNPENIDKKLMEYVKNAYL